MFCVFNNWCINIIFSQSSVRSSQNMLLVNCIRYISFSSHSLLCIFSGLYVFHSYYALCAYGILHFLSIFFNKQCLTVRKESKSNATFGKLYTVFKFHFLVVLYRIFISIIFSNRTTIFTCY